jgi:release factor glutamine methyltransferase
MRSSPTAALRAAVIGDAALALSAAGVESAQHDAEVLAAHALGVDRADLARAAMFSGPQFELFRSLVIRRANREPLQYIVGKAAFRRLDVLVGPGAFVPRPETELVAGWVIDAVQAYDGPVVVDLCTGPGTIALAVAQEVPGARVYAADIDLAAVTWTQRNIAASALPITVEVADVSAAFPELDGTVDAVVSNPPYLVRGTIAQPEVADHDPEIALYAEDDGLAVIRQVVATAERLLRAGGVLAVEHGDDQGDVVAALVQERGFVDVHDHRDLTGRDRFTTGHRP